MNKGNAVHISLFGKDHYIKSPAQPEDMQEYIKFIEKIVQEITLKISLPEPTRVATLALLHVTHELFEARKKQSANEQEVERRITELNKSVKAVMAKEGFQTEIL